MVDGIEAQDEVAADVATPMAEMLAVPERASAVVETVVDRIAALAWVMV